MRTVILPLLMNMAFHQAQPDASSNVAAPCPLIEHVDLSRASSLTSREICVSPGLLTGFLFDVPTDVEVQDEARFMNLSRSRDAISFMPPNDMAPGERLRLTARLGGMKSQQQASFLLVARRDQATHQVHVNHDTRTRESLLQEIKRGHAHNQKLQEDNRRLQQQVDEERAQLGQLTGLSGAYLIEALDATGIRAQALNITDTAGVVTTSLVFSYRSQKQVGLKLNVENKSDEPWTAVGASLRDAQGKHWDGVRLTQKNPALRGDFAKVFIEVEAAPTELQGKVTLTVWEAGPRTVSTQQIVFPR